MKVCLEYWIEGSGLLHVIICNSGPSRVSSRAKAERVSAGFHTCMEHVLDLERSPFASCCLATVRFGNLDDDFGDGFGDAFGDGFGEGFADVIRNGFSCNYHMKNKFNYFYRIYSAHIYMYVQF